MPAETKTNGRLTVGDWVWVPYGPRRVLAQIIEDRGPLGVARRRLYRVLLPSYSGEPVAFEMPANDLELALSKSGILDYLKQGGLLKILQANMQGGPNQPRVWLTKSPKGAVMHTFEPGRGLVGGATVPFFALQQRKVFAPKEKDIVEFLATFGLSRIEATDLIRTVGVYP